MIPAIIIAVVCFTAGNILWPYLGDPKFFYIPLAVLLFLLLLYVKLNAKVNCYVKHLLTWCVLLAGGNVIKQVFYSPELSQVNDYWWGAIITVWLIAMLIKCRIQKVK